MSPRAPRWPALTIAAGAYGLYLWDIGGLKVYGDGGHSIYLATRSLGDIIVLSGVYSHPPLYGVLLKPWLAAAGISELTARWPSVAAAVLAIALVYRLAVVAGARVATVAALLLAASPLLYYYARHPRMYSLVLMLAILGSLLLLRAVERPRFGRWAAYGAAILAMLLTHYYSFLLVAGHAAYLVWRRPDRRAAVGAMATWAAVALPMAAWLAYALAPSLEHTRTNVGAGPPPSLPVMLATTWTSFNFDVFTDAPMMASASLIAGVVWAVGLVSATRRRPRPVAETTLAIAVVVATLVGSYLMAALFAFFHPRYFLFALPFYLLVLAWVLDRTPAAFAYSSVALLVAVAATSVGVTNQVAAQIYEVDAVRASERIVTDLRPDDIVLFHAQWQAGYLLAHHRVAPAQAVGIPELPSEAALAQRLRGVDRVWLATYEMPATALPYGQWLLDHAYLADETDVGKIGLYLFGGPDEIALQPMQRRFANGVELIGASFAPQKLRRGDVLRVRLVWQAATPPQRSTVFLHLEGADGGVGHDGDPARRPAATWPVGEVIDDRRGILITDDLPAGRYRLLVGWYDPPTGRRFSTADGQDALLLGSVVVE